MATHSSILAEATPWTEEPGGPQSVGSQRVGYKLVTKQQRQRLEHVQSDDTWSPLRKQPTSIATSLTWLNLGIYFYGIKIWGMFKSLLLVLLSRKESPEEDKDMEQNAALKIQAAFRGHLAREEVKKMKSSGLEEEKTEENDWGDWLYPTENKNPNPSTLLWLSFFLSKWDLM